VGEVGILSDRKHKKRNLPKRSNGKIIISFWELGKLEYFRNYSNVFLDLSV
jgi:hypothetical protein